jgi:hypothetical protein
VHFITAFLLVVLLPVFPWAEELPRYMKYEGPIKPGVVITKENWDTYLPELEKLLPPSKLQWYGIGVKEGLVTMPIVKAKYYPGAKGKVRDTWKYKGTARVTADNQLVGWVAGWPFPEPKNALEIAWNLNPSMSRTGDDLVDYIWFGLFQGTKYEKHFKWRHAIRKYRARTDIPPLGDLPDFTEKGIVGKEALVITEPNEIKGFIQLRITYWDIGKPDESYAYLPSIRRVRRLTGADMTDPLLGSDAVPDDFETWRQKIDSKMTFRVLEHRDFLVPIEYVGIENKPAYDYKKHGPCFQVEWEIKPLWVLEIMINDPNYAYSKRVNYIGSTPLNQGGWYPPYWAEEYDQRGRLWKANGYGALAKNKDGLSYLFNWIYMNCQTNHYTVMDGYPDYFEDFDKKYPLDEEEFSIKGLLKYAH